MFGVKSEEGSLSSDDVAVQSGSPLCRRGPWTFSHHFDQSLRRFLSTLFRAFPTCVMDGEVGLDGCGWVGEGECVCVRREEGKGSECA